MGLETNADTRGGKSLGIQLGGIGSRDAEPTISTNGFAQFVSTDPLNATKGRGYKSPEYDALFATVKSNPDQKVRAAAMFRINQLMMAEDVLEVTLLEVPDFFVWNAKLRGVESGYSYLLRINSVWWSDKAEPGPWKGK